MKMKKVLRVLCPIVAGLVALLLSHSHSFAQTQASCSQADYRAYQQTKETAQFEMTPERALSLSEAYLAKCPTRPEAGRVALSAAGEALDADIGDKALTYFQMAAARGAAFDQEARLGYIIALTANGEQETAWLLRDEEVALWLAQTNEDGLARLEHIQVPGGTIHKASFEEVDPVRRERISWLAVPHGAGLPVSVSLSSEVPLVEMARLHKGAAAEGLQQLVLNRCGDRETLDTRYDSLPEDEAHLRVVTLLTDYLGAPDLTAAKNARTCYAPERLFVAPNPMTAIRLY